MLVALWTTFHGQFTCHLRFHAELDCVRVLIQTGALIANFQVQCPSYAVSIGDVMSVEAAMEGLVCSHWIRMMDVHI